MKKIINIVIVTISILLFVSGCNNDGYNRNKNYFIEINNVDNFVTKYESDIVEMIVISQTTCSYCHEYKKIINKVAYDEDANIYWLEYDLLTKTEKEEIQNLNDRFERFGTPLTIFVKNGEIVDELNGKVGAEAVIAKLKQWELV